MVKNIEYPYVFSVIMPVYNVAAFLDEALDSIVKQTIGFDKIQVILVDDGSTDKSGDICERFKHRYPEQTTVIHKKNGGQASARNMALPCVQGQYIAMPDPDDKLKTDVLKKIARFFDQYRDVDVCAIPIELFGNASGAHVLNYKFEKGTRVVDLLAHENMDCIQLSAASSFFRTSSAQEVRFDTALYQAEDAKFLLEILMKKPTLGLVAGTTYYYRKYGSSTLDRSRFDKRAYTLGIQRFSQWGLDTAEDKYGFIPKFVQYTVMYDLQWKIKQQIIQPGVLSQKDEEDYRKLLFSIASRIDDDVILSQRHLGLAYKSSILTEKYGTFPARSYKTKGKTIDDSPTFDCVLKYGDMELTSVSQMRTGLEFVSFNQTEKTLTLEGYHIFYGGISENEISLFLIVNGRVVECEQITRKNVDLSLGQPVAWRIGFRASIPLDTDTLSIHPTIIMDGKLIPKEVLHCEQFFPLSHLYKNMRAYSGRWMMKLSGGELIITRRPIFVVRFIREAVLLVEIWNKNLLGGRKAVFGRMLYHLVKPFKRKKLWIVSDRIMKADDNGEALFRFLMNYRPENINVLFAISKHSPDAARIAKIGPCVDSMSFRHKFLHLLCDVNISSQADGVTVNPYFGHSAALQDLLMHSHYVFLQHGVTKDDISNWINRYNKNISGLITSAQPEYDSIINGDYGYSTDKVWLVGMPRFDRLYHKEEKTITLMPTWRQYLMGSIDSRTSVWNPRDDFESSSYFRFYCELLNSARLLDFLEKHGFTLQFFPHPTLRLSGVQFTHDTRVKILPMDASYRDIYAASSLVITDYSSAVFDFAYLRKPIVYCQFDSNEFFSGEHVYTHGYFEYERDGFGEVEYDLESTIDRIIEYVENGCKLKPLYRERIDRFFAFRDQDNCKRVVQKIMDLPESCF